MRVALAVVVGLAGSVFIWVVTPYNNFVLNSAYISDSSLPVAALLAIVSIVLVLNPLLRLVSPRLVLNSRQLSLVLALMLVASVLPGQGLLRELPYCLARACQAARQDRVLAEAYEAMRLRPALFPERFDTRADDWIAERFIAELLPGESIPWAAWVAPFFSWGTFLLSCWLMTVGLSLIVFPQWRRNERLAFPLLSVYQSLVEAPGEGRVLPPLLRSKPFWTGAGTVFVLHLLSGLDLYYPGAVPAVPLKWDLGRLFTEGVLGQVPNHIYESRIYFIFLAVAFFMPSRIGFSVWFFSVVYAFHKAIVKVYFPPYFNESITDQRIGATIALTLSILWLGHAHWARVLGCLARRARSDEDRSDRAAGWMFLAGCAGMFAWLAFYARVQWPWALVFVGSAFMFSLVIARLVAETGMPFMRLDIGQSFPFVQMANPALVTMPTLYFSYFITILFTIGSRVSSATMATHAIGVDANASPRDRTRLGLGLVGVLVVGLGVCGAAHLWCSYNYSRSLDGRKEFVSPSGVTRLDHAHKTIVKFQSTGTLDPSTEYNQKGRMLFGAALAGALQWACLVSPRFPVHPIGLLTANTYYANLAWASVMLGWFLKILIVRYGGARLYRKVQPLFIGLILGETFAAGFWAIVAPLRALLGLEYFLIEIQPQ